MSELVQIEAGDRVLLAHIGEVMAEAALRSGEWLVCRPGCTQCCMGPFAITYLDARRLQLGLDELCATDPERASRVRSRAVGYIEAIRAEYPGDQLTGALSDEGALPDWMDDLACPALDPETGRCDLYESRPVTCRTFGPVTRTGEATFAACELCYTGASVEEMASCAVDVDPEGLEVRLLAALPGVTIVAYALATAGAAQTPDS